MDLWIRNSFIFVSSLHFVKERRKKYPRDLKRLRTNLLKNRPANWMLNLKILTDTNHWFVLVIAVTEMMTLYLFLLMTIPRWKGENLMTQRKLRHLKTMAINPRQMLPLLILNRQQICHMRERTVQFINLFRVMWPHQQSRVMRFTVNSATVLSVMLQWKRCDILFIGL